MIDLIIGAFAKLAGGDIGRKQIGYVVAFYGFWVLGGLMAFVLMFFPEFRWPWSHFVVYPIGSVVAIFTVIIAIAVRSSKSASATRKDQTEQSPRPCENSSE